MKTSCLPEIKLESIRMTFKQLQPTMFLSSQTNCEQIFNQSLVKSSKKNLCQVCGDIARGVNYGALSCPACRAFFRRHGFRSGKIISCPFNGQCEVQIHKQQRRACIACRLAKCLAVGMNIDFFREVIKKKEKCHSLTKTVACQSSSFVSQLPTLSLLNHNRSSLSSAHWTLLSNVVHAYDIFSSIPNVCYAIKQLTIIPNSQLSDTSIMMKIADISTASMISIVRCIPDFQILTITEQRSLLERNMQGTTGLNFIFVSRDSGCIDSSAFLKDISSIYGYETISRMKYLQSQLDSDSTVVKLILIIFAFSSNCSAVTKPENLQTDPFLLGTFRLFGSQNVYVELLWKYMIYRYGYYNAVIRFNYLIQQILFLINHITNSCMKIKPCQIHLDNIFNENKHPCIITSTEHIPLWGIT